MKHEYDPTFDNQKAEESMNANYFIRWRAKRDEDGKIMTDSQGVPVM